MTHQHKEHRLDIRHECYRFDGRLSEARAHPGSVHRGDGPLGRTHYPLHTPRPILGEHVGPPLVLISIVWASYWTAAILWVGDYAHRLRIHVSVWIRRRARDAGPKQEQAGCVIGKARDSASPGEGRAGLPARSRKRGFRGSFVRCDSAHSPKSFRSGRRPQETFIKTSRLAGVVRPS